jgi:glycosyltransferase involved in cell wall biosynthesis
MLRAAFRRRPPARRALPLPPATPGAREPPPGITLIVPQGVDAVAHCNRQAAAATGGKIAIWDGVSAPHAGWLEALAAALDHAESAGMVGAILLASDGHIASAGADIMPDGSLRPRGAGEHPTHPAFASLLPVEALPLGAVMVPSRIWRRFNGLDETIESLPTALADLGLRLRGAGQRVLVQPAARMTAATAPPADRWAESVGRWRLRRRRTANGDGLAALGLRRPAAPRALFVDNFVPTPDRDAASIDMVWYLRTFVALGYDVTLLPVADLARADRYVDELRQHGVKLVANGWAVTPEEFLARDPVPYDLLVVFRVTNAVGVLPEQLRAHSPDAKLVFNTVDLHFLRLEREALLLRSPEKLDESFRVQQMELAAIARADCSILLSPVEQPLIADLLPRAPTYVIPIARDVPGRAAPFAARSGVLFVGGFRHRPNGDAILAFVRDVWPLVRGKLAITLSIVGAEPPAELRALHNPAAGVAVLGQVEDLGTLLAQCRLTVAPLRFGAGTKGKIVTTLAAGVPCVASPIAVEGMGLTDGVHVRVACTPEEYADAIADLHEDEPAWTALSDAGLTFAEQNFSVAGLRRRLAAMLRDLGLPAGN